jgi:hypothetical protein
MRAKLLLLAATLAVLGCTPPRPPDDVAPMAKATALERARGDFACDALEAEIVQDTAPGGSPYDIDRREYRIPVRGCGKRAEYIVACTKWGRCSALTQGALIERSD